MRLRKQRKLLLVDRPTCRKGRESQLNRQLFAEFLGTCFLVTAVVGSGIMATNLTSDVGLQLLINMLATVMALAVSISLLQGISGAHFNPAVSLAAFVGRDLSGSKTASFVSAQILGGVAGATLANIMFSLPAWSVGSQDRTGFGLLFGEVIATAGLVLAINALVRTQRSHLIAIVIPAWIGAAYFFTASTSFANPAVTIGRAFSDTFAGIAPSSVVPFIIAQLIGVVVGLALTRIFYPLTPTRSKESPE